MVPGAELLGPGAGGIFWVSRPTDRALEPAERPTPQGPQRPTRTPVTKGPKFFLRLRVNTFSLDFDLFKVFCLRVDIFLANLGDLADLAASAASGGNF